MVKGGHHSEETKARIRMNHVGTKGQTRSDETRKRISESKKGYRHSEETRAKMSKAQMGHQTLEGTRIKIRGSMKGKNTGKYIGEKGSNWKGGISFEPYTPEFNENLKDLVRERDGYICQICGKTQRENGCKLAVHHIDYNKKNNVMENLKALCTPCHGITNYDREFWTNCLQG